ncbi:MAG: hypothetical protein ACRCX8_08725 [Sarcina sp.]
MYYRTMKLKRYKLIQILVNIISFPIRFPIFIVCIVSEKVLEISEFILNGCDKFLYWIMDNMAKYFKFNEIADRQYEKNKEKFKMDKIKTFLWRD